MRILHVIASLDQSQGGPPRVALGLARALAHLGHEVTILTSGVAGWQAADLAAPAGSPGRLTVIQPPNHGSLYRTGQALLGSHDVVHFHGLWHPQGGLLARACRRQGVPYVLAPHGELDVWALQQKALKKHLHLALVGKSILRQAAALHLLNEDEVAGLRQAKLPGRYFVLGNGLDPAEWAALPPRGEYRARCPQIGDRLLIVFMARLHHKKGPELLLEAYADLAANFPDTCLVIAGPDYGLEASLRAFVAAHGLEDRVFLPGLVTGRERQALLVDADLFVLPSHQEGHPLSVIEAAYVGKTLLISCECHCPELPAGQAAEVVADTCAGVREGLQRLLAAPQYREQLAAEAQRLARELYVWPRLAEQLAKHYETARHQPDAFPRV